MQEPIRKWTVVIRNRRGDPWFHRVPDLELSYGQARQLSEYLMRQNPRCQSLPAWLADSGQVTVRVKRKNRQWSDIKIRENGTLPFDTNPKKGAISFEDQKLMQALIDTSDVIHADEMADQDQSEEPHNGIRIAPLQNGMFNIYDGEVHIGEVDYNYTLANKRGSPSHAWFATAYTWGLEGVNLQDIFELGAFHTRVAAVSAVVRQWREFHNDTEN